MGSDILPVSHPIEFTAAMFPSLTSSTIYFKFAFTFNGLKNNKNSFCVILVHYAHNIVLSAPYELNQFEHELEVSADSTGPNSLGCKTFSYLWVTGIITGKPLTHPISQEPVDSSWITGSTSCITGYPLKHSNAKEIHLKIILINATCLKAYSLDSTEWSRNNPADLVVSTKQNFKYYIQEKDSRRLF